MFKTPQTTALTKKAEATTARILDVALDLFRRQEFEQTTMRGIAAEGEVSLGSACYYFESKEDLVMAFYDQAIEAMTPRMEAALAGATSFEERIASTMAVKFEDFRPNRSFLGALFRHAANPQKRLSPFSEATRHIRECNQPYFARAIATKSGGARMPEDLAPFLPNSMALPHGIDSALDLRSFARSTADPCVAREESGASGQRPETVRFLRWRSHCGRRSWSSSFRWRGGQEHA
jgi:AcrR family transcriptional regulator